MTLASSLHIWFLHLDHCDNLAYLADTFIHDPSVKYKVLNMLVPFPSTLVPPGQSIFPNWRYFLPCFIWWEILHVNVLPWKLLQITHLMHGLKYEQPIPPHPAVCLTPNSRKIFLENSKGQEVFEESQISSTLPENFPTKRKFYKYSDDITKKRPLIPQDPASLEDDKG